MIKNGINCDKYFNIGSYKSKKWNGKCVVIDLISFKLGEVTICRMDNNFNNLLIMTGDVMKEKKTIKDPAAGLIIWKWMKKYFSGWFNK